MKSKTVLPGVLTLFILACNLYANVTPTLLAQTATTTPTTIPSPSGSTVTLNNVTFTIPQGLAKDALSEMAPANNDTNSAPWDAAPEHLQFTLTSYALQDKFHQPKIFVYPADAYAQVMQGATDNIQRLKNISAGAQLSKEIMPSIPFFNAGQIIAANMQVLAFQNGSGVRFLTEYAQYPAPINNHELIYHFEGLTSDGKYYIIAILPVTAPILAETDKPDAGVPAGGVPIPADSGPNEAYYAEVTDKLNSLAAEDFQPALPVLDALIQSLIVTP